ncbi:putative cellulose-binding GDSL lipase acylhydrolase [Lyophyllum shimeji]|uniref:Cellulose-binding GDSL lipase acylhydrolase n=1 Tax=Lyophyllum shimeji TaxID=47721 RepID=A0A9P3PMF1_LYOSH|nr:putative cellulose-binding GDSL lipase acylhydrolase [Lyophyllum shimeji]
MLRFSALTAIALALAPRSLAQGAAWSQCGGIGWTGATTCVAGCICTKLNDYYSQCIPGTGSSTSTTSSSSTTPAPPVSTAKANYWFSFGDSYTQTGFSPTGTLPAPGNPLGNPPYPGWTATGGENWVDYVSTQYNKSLILTYNYAYGGATIDANLVAPYTPTVLSLTDQVNQFLSGAGTKPASTPWTSSNALFSIWIGINDIGNSYYLSGDRNAFSDTLLNAYFALVQKLQRRCKELPLRQRAPIDRSPLMLSQGSSATAAEKTVITGFNSKLAAKVAAFKAANSGVSTWIWDSNAAFTTILNNPTAYGFVDATCYGSAANDFWGNNYHPSSYAHKFFGQDVGNLLGSTVW